MCKQMLGVPGHCVPLLGRDTVRHVLDAKWASFSCSSTTLSASNDIMPVDELVFRDYRQQDKATIVALLADGRPASYTVDKLAVFDWQFFANPLSEGRSPFIVGTFNDEIVAVNGLMPVKVRVSGEPMVACWSLDTYVSGKYRGRGFGKALVALVSASAPVMLGFGISDMSDPIFDKANWLLDASMAIFFYHVNEPSFKGACKNLLTRCARLFGVRRSSPGIQSQVEAALPDTEVDRLWSRVAGHYPNAVERNATYLGWRYRDAPVMRYRWVVGRRHGELGALLITRHDPTESVVVDYVGPLDDAALMSSLIEAACADLVAAGTQRIKCEVNHPQVGQALARSGFLRFRSAGRFRVRANLPASAALSAPWFIMTGDSDNDLLGR